MRWKLLVGNVVAVLLIGVIGWFLVMSGAREALLRDVGPSVERAANVLPAVRVQDGDQFVDKVEELAAQPNVAAVYANDSESAQRDAAFTVAQAVSRQLADLAHRNRPAELVALLNAEGRVLARNAERNLSANRDLRSEFPVVRRVFEAGPTGHGVRDFIRFDDQGWMEVAVVPVVVGGAVRGGVLAGFTVSDSAARADSERLGVGVGYIFREGNRYTVQSLSVGSQREKEELVAWANSPAAGGEQLVRGRTEVRVTLGGQEYLGRTIPMPGALTPEGAIVLRSLTEAGSPAGGVAMPALVAMLIGLLLVVGYNLFVAQYLEKPIEQIEEGLLTIVNGNTQHRINVEHAELGGIVYRINQLVASLTGEGDEGSEG